MKSPASTTPVSFTRACLPVIAACMMLGTVSAEVVLFQDDFSGLATNRLNGTTPDVTQGTTAWVANTRYAANGTTTGTVVGAAYLRLGTLIDDTRGNPDAIYTLTATLNVPYNAGSTIWDGIGFYQSTTPPLNWGLADLNGGKGVAWMLRRQNAQIRVFRGPITGNTLPESTDSPNNVQGELDLKVVLDLSSWNGTDNWGRVTYSAKLSSESTYTEIATGPLISTNSSFGSVGLSSTVGGSSFRNFQLTKAEGAAPSLAATIKSFTYDRLTGASTVIIKGAANTTYKLVEADDLDFANPDQDPVPLANAVVGTLDGNKVITTAGGDATVQFNLGTSKPATFVRAEKVP